MNKGIEAVIDREGNVRLLAPLKLPADRRALITILEEPRTEEETLLSEPALGVDWNRPEEDAAWSHLQPHQ